MSYQKILDYGSIDQSSLLYNSELLILVVDLIYYYLDVVLELSGLTRDGRGRSQYKIIMICYKKRFVSLETKLAREHTN